MNMSQLDTRFIPPFAVPMRFFITAPLFALMAALLLFTQPDALTLSRWNESTLAWVHLITLGVLLMVMMGAMMQVLPVLHGRAFPMLQRLPALIHGTLSVGAALLCYGFWHRSSAALQLGAALLLLTLALFGTAFFVAFGRWSTAGNSARSMALSVLALVFTGITGSGLVQGHLSGSWVIEPILMLDKTLTHLHLTLGIKGGVLLLVFAVAQQVIPMFHVTPEFPKRLKKFGPISYFALLMFYLLMVLVGTHTGQQVLVLLELCTSSALTLMALRILQQRKRKIPDTTFRTWQLGWSSLLLGNLLLLSQPWWPSAQMSVLHWWLGVCWLAGFALSIVLGMLLKIVPFLSYLHLQQQAGFNLQALVLVPNMHQLLAPPLGQWLLRLWLVLLLLLALSPFSPLIAQGAALMQLACFLLLAFALWRCWQRYRHYQQQILAAIEVHPA